MRVWWHTNRGRLREEKAAIAELETVADWLENVEWSLDDQFRLQAIFEIRMPHQEFRLWLTYHNTFPSCPPSVTPFEKIRVSGHQYGPGGDLCLEIRPDNWHPHYTGADMISSAHALLREEAPDEDGRTTPAAADHNVSESFRLRGATCRLYLSKGTQHTLGLGVPTRGTVKLALHWCGSRYVVANILGFGDDDLPLGLCEQDVRYEGAVVKVALCGAELSQINTQKELLSVVGREEEDTQFYLVVGSDKEIVLLRRMPGLNEVIRYATILEPMDGPERSGDEYSDLSKKRVGVVGLGSLGSKVAASLARAGVGHFTVVDDDILHAGNLARHDGDWRDVGLHKADLVARRLRLINPVVHCDARRTAIGAQVSTVEAGNLNAALDGCDLIVDATAEPNVFNHLAGLTSGAKGTLVWGGIFAGGLGGEVGRSRPLRDPSPFQIRSAIEEYCSTISEAPPSTSHREYEGHGAGEVLMATDADVSAIGALVADLALDSLVEREPSRFEAHAYLVGLARGWMFEGPFHVQPIIADAPIRTVDATAAEGSGEEEFVDELIQRKLREIEDKRRDD